MELFKSEFEKIWKRKLTWVYFMLIPLGILGASKYYLGNNTQHTITSPEFISLGNYPFMVFQEMLITLFNLFAILLVCTCITQEYRKGEMRLVMIRGYEFKEIFFAKIAAIITTMLIFFVIHFGMSIILGYFIAPKLERVALFYHKDLVNYFEAIGYSGKYYIIGFLTTLSIISVFLFLSLKCRTVTGAIGACLGFIVGSFVFSQTVIHLGQFLGKNVTSFLYFLSLTEIQHQGICVMLAKNHKLTLWMIIVLVGHILIFGGIACKIFNEKDYLI